MKSSKEKLKVKNVLIATALLELLLMHALPRRAESNAKAAQIAAMTKSNGWAVAGQPCIRACLYRDDIQSRSLGSVLECN